MISKEKVEYSKKILYSYLVKKRRNIPIHKLSYLSSGSFAEILDIYGKKVSDSPDKLRELFVDSYLFYKVLFTEFTKLGGLAFDYHVHNVCYSNGKLKVIDFGCGGNFKYAKKDEINFIKVNYPKYEFLKNLLRFKRMKFLKN